MAPKNPTGTPKRVASRSSFPLPTMALAMPPPDSPTGALRRSHNQQASEPVENERQKKKCQSQFNEGLIMQIAASFGELVGDDGSDGIAGRKKRSADGGRIADDHGDGHGFAEGAREGQEDRAKDPRAGEGNDHLPS